jgi:hypothetical protein
MLMMRIIARLHQKTTRKPSFHEARRNALAASGSVPALSTVGVCRADSGLYLHRYGSQHFLSSTILQLFYAPRQIV